MGSKNLMGSVLLLTLLVTVFNKTDGKTYSNCELVDLFRRNGFSDIANWVCLVQSESSGRTDAKGGPNPSNGSGDYGLFQINSKYWCTGEATVSNDCRTSCSNFLNEDLSDDIKCAKKVHGRHGFAGAWFGWIGKCQGRDLSKYVAGC